MSRSHWRLDPGVCFCRWNIISHMLLFRLTPLLFSRGDCVHIYGCTLHAYLNPKSSLNDKRDIHSSASHGLTSSLLCVQLWFEALIDRQGNGSDGGSLACIWKSLLLHTALCEGFTLITLIRHSFTWDMGLSWLQHPFIYPPLMKLHRAGPSYNGM